MHHIRRVSVIAALAALALPGVVCALPVGRIEIEGAKTKPEVVAALLDTRAGEPFDAGVWERDLRRLRNLDYFYDVEGTAREVDGKMELRLRLRNKFSTLPTPVRAKLRGSPSPVVELGC